MAFVPVVVNTSSVPLHPHCFHTWFGYTAQGGRRIIHTGGDRASRLQPSVKPARDPERPPSTACPSVLGGVVFTRVSDEASKRP